MRLEYQVVAEWPPLSWLARCERSRSRIAVFHGSGVDVSDDFFCEAVWAGDYGKGALDETDIVAGSGGRLTGSGLTFVSSGSTVDRLHALRDANGVWISNSLPCLLSVVGATVEPCYAGYYEDFYTVVKGLNRYKRDLVTSAGSIELIYFDNIRWDGANLLVQPKLAANLDLSSFDSYRRFLETSMQLLAENMTAGARRSRYSMLATISTGYDSPTVTALARRAGCREAICFDRSHRGEDDSGEVIAKYLDVRPIRVDGAAWREFEHPEIPFVSANSMGEEVRFKAAEPHLAGRVLLTGYHGDKMWDTHTTALGPGLVRGDPSGLALTEYRLWARFIHCPVPFWGARRIAEVNRISKSAELRSWDVPGDYSRPICRRVVEENGVPRDLFGVTKKNASVILHNREAFLTPSSMTDFLGWLKAHRVDWLKRCRVPPLANATLDRAIHEVVDYVATWAKGKAGLWRLSGVLETKPTYFRKYIFPWALERAKERYVSGSARIAAVDLKERPWSS